MNALARVAFALAREAVALARPFVGVDVVRARARRVVCASTRRLVRPGSDRRPEVEPAEDAPVGRHELRLPA